MKFSEFEQVEGLRPCKKKTLAYAKKIEEPFEVETLEGTMRGKAGDYLMRGASGELYVCDAKIFELSYDFTEPLSVPAYIKYPSKL